MDALEENDKMAQLVAAIDAKRQAGENAKSVIQDRWYQALRQYHGEYENDTKDKLNKSDTRSRVYVGLTRAKTNAWSARLCDMLFPTDDRNWGIKATPVAQPVSPPIYPPHHGHPSAFGGNQAMEFQGQYPPDMPVDTPNENSQVQNGMLPSPTLMQTQTQPDPQEYADDAIEKMQVVMEDQLKESRYQIICRDVIEDSCKLGTGIIKGPIRGWADRFRWQKTKAGFERQAEDDMRPFFARVDPWNFFPDPSGQTPDAWEYSFERHILNAKQLRHLADEPAFIPRNIRKLLQHGTRTTMPSDISERRAIGDRNPANNNQMGENFILWEWHGSLTGETLEMLANSFELEDLMQEEFDPLDEVHVILVYCQNEILKLALHPLESGESLYSLFNFEKDETSSFGYGVPNLMRDSQAALNAAWRMTLDSAKISVGPQVVVNREQIIPMDGNWNISPNKIWARKDDDGTPIKSAFEIYNIPNRQDYLNNILQTAMQFIDLETSLPLIAQGDAATQPVDTATGMTLLMESANVIFRRAVRNWDDDMTRPNMSRLYQWNMQFHEDHAIKGDAEVDARGSSVLMTRNQVGQNLMNFIGVFGAHPLFSALIKPREAVVKIAQTHMLPADEILYSDDEIARRAKENAEQQQNEPSPEVLAMQIEQAKIELAQQEFAHKQKMDEAEMQLKVAEFKTNQQNAPQIGNRPANTSPTDTDLKLKKLNLEENKLAVDSSLKAQSLESQERTNAAKLALEKAKLESGERKVAAEIGVKQQMGTGI